MSQPYSTIRRDVSKKDPHELAELLAQYNQELIPSFRQVRAAFMVLAKDIDAGAFMLGPIVVREVTGTPTSADPNGSVAVLTTGIFTRIGGVWVAIGAGVGSVTAGAGLINSGTAAAPVIDAVALDATLDVEPDGMKVNVISEVNVDETIVTDAVLTELVSEMREDAAHIRMLLLQQIKLELGMTLDNVDGL